LHDLFRYHSAAQSNQSNSSASTTTDSRPTPQIIDSINNTTEHQIFTLDDNQAPEIIDTPHFASLDPSIVANAMETRDHTIKDFLSRRRKIYSGNVTAGGASGDVITKFSFPSTLLALAPIREKINNFTFLRANIGISIVLAAPPTLSGGIRVLQIPDIPSTYLTTRTITQLQQSQFPNQVFSLSTRPNIELDIPWISEYTHRNLTLSYPNPQHLLICKTSAASHPYRMHIYAWFITDDDTFDLSLPTAATAYYPPISDTIDMEEYQKFVRMKAGNVKTQTKKQSSHKTTKTTPSKSTKVKTPKPSATQPNTEAVATEGGLSQVASVVGSVAKTLEGIPVIGGVASTVATVAHFAHGLFSAFGWSRPNDEMPTKTMKIHPANHHITCDSTHTSHTFGVQTLNKVALTSGTFGSSLDDMSYKNICSQPNYIGSLTINTSSTAGATLASYPVYPFVGCSIPNTTVSTTPSITTLTHQGYIAALHNYWQASFVFKFKFFLTHFHSFKLRFAFVPYQILSNAPAWEKFDDNNSVVVDFGENDEFEIKCNAAINRLFMDSALLYQPDAQTISADTSHGRLYVIVELPLVVTSTIVSSTVYGIVEMHMENPRFGQMSDLALAPILDTPSTKTMDASNILTQSLTTSSPTQSTADAQSSGNSSTNLDADDHDLSAYAEGMGECIVSLRQLTTQFTSPRRIDISPPNTDRALVSIRTTGTYLYLVDPINPRTTTDKIDYILSAFAFIKGSTHLRLFFPKDYPENFVYTYTKTIANARYRTTTTDFTPATIIGPESTRVIPVHIPLEGVVDIHQPYYQPYHMVRNVPTSYSQSDHNDYNQNVTCFNTPSTYVTKIQYSRAMGDDFSAGYLIGLPQFARFSSSSDRFSPIPPQNLTL